MEPQCESAIKHWRGIYRTPNFISFFVTLPLSSLRPRIPGELSPAAPGTPNPPLRPGLAVVEDVGGNPCSWLPLRARGWAPAAEIKSRRGSECRGSPGSRRALSHEEGEEEKEKKERDLSRTHHCEGKQTNKHANLCIFLQPFPPPFTFLAPPPATPYPSLSSGCQLDGVCVLACASGEVGACPANAPLQGGLGKGAQRSSPSNPTPLHPLPTHPPTSCASHFWLEVGMEASGEKL